MNNYAINGVVQEKFWSAVTLIFLPEYFLFFQQIKFLLEAAKTHVNSVKNAPAIIFF